MRRRTQETKEEITKNWFRLRKAFDDGKIPPPMAQEVSWLLDYIDIMTDKFNEARKQIPDEDLIEKFVKNMETDASLSSPRSSDFESGKRWVLRRARIIADLPKKEGS